jgi:hypothetical protein
VAVA